MIESIDWQRTALLLEALSTLGLVAFAAVQVALSVRNEKVRRREFIEERNTKRDAAYGALWGEYNRIVSVSERLLEADLVDLCLRGRLDPEEILPRSWSTTIEMLGQLGLETAQLGGVALTVANDAAREIEGLMRAVLSINRANMRHEDQCKMVRSLMPNIADTEARIKELVKEVDELLDDALRHAPDAEIPHAFRFKRDMKSYHGRHLVEEYDKLVRKRRSSE